jgi:two-component system sensor histidine kinase BarA
VVAGRRGDRTLDLDAAGAGAMSSPATPHDFAPDDFALEGKLRLEDLIDRGALLELCKSFFALFAIPVRIYSSEGTLLAEVSGPQEICAYVNTVSSGRAACGKTVSAAKSIDPGPGGDVLHPCFTGAAYRIVALEYDKKAVGRIVLGPFLPAGTVAPESLLELDAGLDPSLSRSRLPKMPNAQPETITHIAHHLAAALDLILFSSHKAMLTSHMHVASIREGYRQLEDKSRRLQEAYDQLKEVDRLKSNFLATVSHELRTPLTSIIGYTEMLKEGIAGPLAGEQVEFVQTIYEKGEQLLALIMGLLDLSKLESGTLSIRQKAVSIGTVLAEVLSTLTPTAQKKGVLLKVDAPDGVPTLMGDAVRLRQVFLNLAENAIKFTPKGGSVVVRASAIEEETSPGTGEAVALFAHTETKLEVRVIDTGIGLPVRERKRVFDPFYQVDSSSTREHGGTGLGLSIVKRLVEAHAGAIRIEDNEPEGTQFVVTLPLSKPGQAARPRDGA